MPAIPEFILRKLYVPGSLKASPDGFELQLNNTLAAVTLTGLGLTADEQPCDPQGILLRLPSGQEISAAAVSGDQPFSMTINTLIGVQVRAPMPRKRLVVCAETREAGTLQFSLPLAGGRPGKKAHSGLLDDLRRKLQFARRAWRTRRDPQHPAYHFTPPANWMNDPNGLICWQGTYHMFYQYNPYEAVWGNIHWGHASSPDLLHWRHHPIALSPDADGADAGGCFSGCAVDDGGRATLIYTGVFPETQCLARSTGNDLLTWKKHPRPVIPAPPEGLALEGFRDPCVWKEGPAWRMALGSGLRGQGGAVLLYGSQNLTEWQYLGILYQKDPQPTKAVPTGTMWECPSFFPLGEKWVLLLSVCATEGPITTIYYVGDYHANRFIPQGPARRLDHGAGGCFYAPQTFLSAGGERLMIGWLREARSQDEMQRAGWSGAMSLPRRLSLDKDGGLACAPLAETARLRREGRQPSSRLGAQLEILAQVQPGAAPWSGVYLEAGPGEAVQIGFDRQQGVVVVDCRPAGGLLSTLPLEKDVEQLDLHLFVDGSVLEVFVDDRQAISARFYVKQPQALRTQWVGDVRASVWNVQKQV